MNKSLRSLLGSNPKQRSLHGPTPNKGHHSPNLSFLKLISFFFLFFFLFSAIARVSIFHQTPQNPWIFQNPDELKARFFHQKRRRQNPDELRTRVFQFPLQNPSSTSSHRSNNAEKRHRPLHFLFPQNPSLSSLSPPPPPPQTIPTSLLHLPIQPPNPNIFSSSQNQVHHRPICQKLQYPKKNSSLPIQILPLVLCLAGSDQAWRAGFVWCLGGSAQGRPLGGGRAARGGEGFDKWGVCEE